MRAHTKKQTFYFNKLRKYKKSRGVNKTKMSHEDKNEVQRKNKGSEDKDCLRTH